MQKSLAGGSRRNPTLQGLNRGADLNSRPVGGALRADGVGWAEVWVETLGFALSHPLAENFDQIMFADVTIDGVDQEVR